MTELRSNPIKCYDKTENIVIYITNYSIYGKPVCVKNYFESGYMVKGFCES